MRKFLWRNGGGPAIDTLAAQLWAMGCGISCFGFVRLTRQPWWRRAFSIALLFVGRQVGASGETRGIETFDGFGHFILDIFRGWRE